MHAAHHLPRREGPPPPTYIHPLGGAEDRVGEIYTVLRTNIGVVGIDWDRCVIKEATWPGTWTLGVVFRTRDGMEEDFLERCYLIQGGRPGTIDLFGWRPKIRASRQDLKLKSAKTCPGFVEQQRKTCEELKR